jgi:hypothetical protein
MKVLLLFCCLVAFTSMAQTSSDDVIDLYKVNVTWPGLSVEKRVNQLRTVQLEIAVRPAFRNFPLWTTTDSIFRLGMDPSVAIQYRAYSDPARRISRGRSTAQNSMNFFAFHFQSRYVDRNLGFFDLFDLRFRGLRNNLGVVWGIQRNYPEKTSLNAFIGGGFTGFLPINSPSGNSLTARPALFGGLRVGFWFKKKVKE